MLIDKLSHIHKYSPFLPHLDAALACLKEKENATVGRYEFAGGFLMIQSGTTSSLEGRPFEAHREYLDLQILLEGKEEIEWNDIAELKPQGDYHADVDREGFTGKGSIIEILPGTFYVCFPHDGHKACGYISTVTPYRKAVIKLQRKDKALSYLDVQDRPMLPCIS